MQMFDYIIGFIFEELTFSLNDLLFRGGSGKGSGDRYLNHRNTIEKWYAKQERIQIAESNTPTAHLMNSSPTRSINIFKTETNQGTVT